MPKAQLTIIAEVVHDGDTTVAIVDSFLASSSPGKETHLTTIGTAKRNSSDPRNDSIGERLALGRALRKLGSQTYRSAWNDVRNVDEARKKHLALSEKKKQEALKAGKAAKVAKKKTSKKSGSKKSSSKKNC